VIGDCVVTEWEYYAS